MNCSIRFSNDLSRTGCAPRQRPWTRQRGVTLVELLTVITITGIVLGAGPATLATVMEGRQVTGAATELLTTFHLARSEAIKRRGRVVVCKSPDGASCAKSGGWQQGWVMFHDANNNAALDAGEAVILRTGALDAALRLTGNANVADYVSFAPTGSGKMVSGAFQAGTLTVCRQSLAAVEASQLVLSATGRTRLTPASLPDCI